MKREARTHQNSFSLYRDYISIVTFKVGFFLALNCQRVVWDENTNTNS